MATVQVAFERIVRMRLPVCFDDVLVQVDPNMFRVPQVLDELAQSEAPAPSGVCAVLGLEPGASFRQAVERYRLSMAPPAPQPPRARERKPHRLRLRLVENSADVT